ncbi:MAG: hypothetical protein ACRC2R_24020 [Xenococcaceae cyanobacterium]
MAIDKYQFSISPIVAAISLTSIAIFADEVKAEIVQGSQQLENQSARTIISSARAADLLKDELKTENYFYFADTRLSEFCGNYLNNSVCTEEESPEIAQQLKPSLDVEKVRTDENQTGWGAVADVSTLGVGGALVAAITPDLNARIGVNGFETTLDVDETEVTYAGDLNIFNVSTILDYHIGGSDFRISAGLIFNDNTAEGIGRPFAGGIEIGDRTFSSEELGSVDADIEFGNDVSPYVGLGWGNPAGRGKGLGFWFNAGVMFAGSPQVSLSPTFGAAARGNEIVINEVDRALDRETNRLKDKLDDFSVYPVVSLGFTYRF